MHSESSNDDANGTDMEAICTRMLARYRAGQDGICRMCFCRICPCNGECRREPERILGMLIRSSDNMIGAFVWDWVDQSRLISLDTLPKNYDFN